MTVFIPAIFSAMNTNNEDDVKPDLVGGVTSRLRTEDYEADDETTSTSSASTITDGRVTPPPAKTWIPEEGAIRRGLVTPLRYDAVPRLYLPLSNGPGIFEAIAAAPTMFGFIVNQIPIPNQMLSGYHATDGEEVTESRRIHVTRYYYAMMKADFGRIEGKGNTRRSARILALREAAEQDLPDSDRAPRKWFDKRPHHDDDFSS